MTPRYPSIRRVSALGCCTLLGLGLVACGDDDADAADAADAIDQPATVSNEIAGVGAVAEQLGDAMGDEAAASLDQAIDSLGDDTMMGIVADQLGDGTTFEIDGTDVTFTIPSGTNDGVDPITDCMIIQSFADEAATVKVVYPDGETTC